MMRKPPQYCQGFLDRHGSARWYFRRPGFDRVALPGLPWSPEFMAAYEAAAKGEPNRNGAEAAKTVPGTVAALVASYYRSSEYQNLNRSRSAPIAAPWNLSGRSMAQRSWAS